MEARRGGAGCDLQSRRALRVPIAARPCLTGDEALVSSPPRSVLLLIDVEPDARKTEHGAHRSWHRGRHRDGAGAGGRDGDGGLVGARDDGWAGTRAALAEIERLRRAL